MKLTLVFLSGFLGCGVFIGFGLAIERESKYRDKCEAYEKLKWANVRIKEAKDESEKSADYRSLRAAYLATGMPVNVLYGVRRAEWGGVSFELGFRGATAGIVGNSNLSPDEWQYAEAGRRWNELAWQWIQADTDRYREATIYCSSKYVGKPTKQVKEYAKVIRERSRMK